MATPVKEIQYRRLNTEKSLCISDRANSQHLALADSSPSVRCFYSVVGVLRRIMGDAGHYFSVSHPIASKFVSDQSIGWASLPLEQFAK